MRYLLFNLIVFAALAYLATGNGADPRDWVGEKLSGRMVETSATAAPERVAETPPPAAETPEHHADKEDDVRPVATSEISSPPEPDQPATSQDRDAPASEIEVAAIEVPTASPAFMTRTERRRELDRLIQDMEGRFLERLGN